jgi:hypothetical protein
MVYIIESAIYLLDLLFIYTTIEILPIIWEGNLPCGFLSGLITGNIGFGAGVKLVYYFRKTSPFSMAHYFLEESH